MSTSASVISSRPLPTLPTAVPVTVKRAAHVKRRNASPAAKIPEGYAFLPPPVPSYARGAQAYAQADRVRGAHQHGGTDEEVLRTGRGGREGEGEGERGARRATGDDPSGCGRNAVGGSRAPSAEWWGVWWRGGFAGRPPQPAGRVVCGVVGMVVRLTRWSRGPMGYALPCRGPWVYGDRHLAGTNQMRA
ncbi:hypothetical protein K438DRAFT_1791501 [Mycena galopus ATCC 62051]|nr:hypothetical protein K438DRAFT_1791501 [Mycena galopus ATCC 62051]